MRDLGLTYEQAVHGVQSAIKFELQKKGLSDEAHVAIKELKHHRVGIDTAKADQGGLAALLIKKGVITLDEYKEAMRLAANEELARYTEHVNATYGVNVMFR